MALSEEPTKAQLEDVAFESGVAANGTVAAKSFASWLGTSPPTYTASQGLAQKWTDTSSGVSTGAYGTAGTPGGTVTYSFGANVSAAQQTAFEDALSLWSDEANITFAPAAAGKTADLSLKVTSSGGTSNTPAPQDYSVAGSGKLPNALTPTRAGGGQDTIVFDDSGGYGTLGSFSAAGGYGESALVHEMGHMIGLGHAGPYNDGTGISQDDAQFNAYDSRQWSVMSYIEPGADAKYSASYPVKGTHWTSVSGGNTSQVAPETPMIDDILAAQSLYGAPTSTALSGGQVFGFNCNITDGSRAFFDFSVNTNPVVTLYDTGTDNTLDCSGFTKGCKIDLNPGTFSSAGGTGTRLTNNIGIAYGTQIDTAIGGSGNDKFIVNADSDTIDGGGGKNTVILSGARSGYRITQSGGFDATVKDKATGAIDTLSDIQTLKFANTSLNLRGNVVAADAAAPVCYAAGTRIRVARDGTVHDIAVEHLVIGDLVVTASGARRPIRWLGHRTMRCAGHREPAQIKPADVQPVRIAAHALGPQRPARDLVVSPGHAICVDAMGEVLVPAAALVDGIAIVRLEVEEVTYWHVELDGHDLLLAENIAAESYLEMGNRRFFAEAEVVALHARPDAPVATHAGFCRPYVCSGPRLDAVRARIAALRAALDRGVAVAPVAQGGATAKGRGCGTTGPRSTRMP